MPVSPELGTQLAKEVLTLYTEAEEILLKKLAKRLAKGLDQPSWVDDKLREVQDLRRDARREVQRLTKEGLPAVQDAVGKAYNRGSATAGTDLTKLKQPPGIAFAVTDVATVEALASEAVTNLQASHLRILRSTDDIYRQVISQTAAQTTLGSVTRREAAQRALDKFAMHGITGYIDSAGRSWDLASYAEMATRAATGNAAVSGHVDRLAAVGHDTVIVSDAPEECRICREWEGAVLSISGRTAGQTLEDGVVVKASLAAATAAGLFHPGCRHSTGIYIPGLTRPLKGTADPKGDLERQQQRQLERGVRQWKRREAVAMSPEVEAHAKAKVRDWQGKLKQHVDVHDRKRLRAREGLGAR